MPSSPRPTVAFQGLHGAYSELACRRILPEATTLPCSTFEQAIEAVRRGAAEYAVLPCENSLAGRVSDIHSLLPDSGLFIQGEYFLRIEHALLGCPGAALQTVRRVHSHPVALAQVRRLIAEIGAEAVADYDTAGAAQLVARLGNPQDAAVASTLAAEIYGLEVLRANVEDAAHNTTRFYLTARAMNPPPAADDDNSGNVITSLIFTLRSLPGALYQALACFAQENVNLTKLESYMVGGNFAASRFFCEVEGHAVSSALRRALAALEPAVTELRILGIYPASPFRTKEGSLRPQDSH